MSYPVVVLVYFLLGGLAYLLVGAAILSFGLPLPLAMAVGMLTWLVVLCSVVLIYG